MEQQSRWAEMCAPHSKSLAELRALSEDKEWLETVVAHLPERR